MTWGRFVDRSNAKVPAEVETDGGGEEKCKQINEGMNAERYRAGCCHVLTFVKVVGWIKITILVVVLCGMLNAIACRRRQRIDDGGVVVSVKEEQQRSDDTEIKLEHQISEQDPLRLYSMLLRRNRDNQSTGVLEGKAGMEANNKTFLDDEPADFAELVVNVVSPFIVQQRDSNDDEEDEEQQNTTTLPVVELQEEKEKLHDTEEEPHTSGEDSDEDDTNHRRHHRKEHKRHHHKKHGHHHKRHGHHPHHGKHHKCWLAVVMLWTTMQAVFLLVVIVSFVTFAWIILWGPNQHGGGGCFKTITYIVSICAQLYWFEAVYRAAEFLKRGYQQQSVEDVTSEDNENYEIPPPYAVDTAADTTYMGALALPKKQKIVVNEEQLPTEAKQLYPVV